MLKQLTVLSSVLSSLLVSAPVCGKYLSNLDIGTQVVSNSNQEGIGVIYSGITNIIKQNKQYVAFSDVRLSSNDYLVQGLHVGFGARRYFEYFSIGIHSFYDFYNNKNQAQQYVGGFEVLHPSFHVRWNYYYPHTFQKDVYIGMHGYEGELGIKIAKTDNTFLSLKKYDFIDETLNKISGYGASIKYASSHCSKFNFYVSAGYQHDHLYSHQLLINGGIKIAVGSSNDLQENCYATVSNFSRDMFVYGHNSETSKAIIYTSKQDIHDVIEKAPPCSVIMLKDDIELEKTIKLKSCDTLYGNPTKKTKISAKKSLAAPLVEISNDSTIKNIEFDGAKLTSKSVAHAPAFSAPANNNSSGGGGDRHPKTPDPKTPEPKIPEPKTPEPKTPDPKTPDPKTPEPKIPDHKSHKKASAPVVQNTVTDTIIFAPSKVKNVKILNSNIYGHAQDPLHGILLNEGGTNIKIKNNLIKNNNKISGIQAHGLLENSEISNNTIDGKGEETFGISLDNAKNNKMSDNHIHIQGQLAHGIYAFDTQGINIIENNEIRSTGEDAHAIYLHQVATNTVIKNNQFNSAGKLSGHSLYLWDGGKNNTITGNEIITSGGDTDGIHFNGIAESNIITKNKVTTDGKDADGIYIKSKAKGNNITGNETITSGKSADGIYFNDTVESNIITKNKVTTDGKEAYGIYAFDTQGVNIIENNEIRSTGEDAHAIYLHQVTTDTVIKNNQFNSAGKLSGHSLYLWDGGKNNTITGNEIITSGGDTDGIYFGGIAESNIITKNKVTTDGKDADAIYIKTDATANRIEGNKIITKAEDADGIYINGKAKGNNIIDNEIITSGGDTDGIHFSGIAESNTLTKNKVTTAGKEANGIYAFDTQGVNIIENNEIRSTGEDAHAIYLHQVATDTVIKNNQFNSAGKLSGHSLYLWDGGKNNTITGNEIITSGGDTDGIYFGGIAESNIITKNKVTTDGKDADAIYIKTDATANRIEGNKIITKAEDADGIYINGKAKGNNIIDNEIITSGASANGIYFAAITESNTLTKNKVTTDGEDANAIHFHQGVTSTAINNNTFNSAGGAHGHSLCLWDGGTNNTITGNEIITSGDKSDGIHFIGIAESNTLTKNKVTTDGNDADGIYIKSKAKGNNITGNEIITSGKSADGMHFSNTAESNTITKNEITTDGEDADGIYIKIYAADNKIEGNKIITKAEDADGIYISGKAQGNNIINNEMIIKGKDANTITFADCAEKNLIKKNSLCTEDLSTSTGVVFKKESYNNIIEGNKLFAEMKSGSSSSSGASSNIRFEGTSKGDKIYDNTMKLNRTDQAFVGGAIIIKDTVEGIEIKGNNIDDKSLYMGSGSDNKMGIGFLANTGNTIIDNNVIAIAQKNRDAIKFKSTKEAINKDEIIKNNTITTNGGDKVKVN